MNEHSCNCLTNWHHEGGFGAAPCSASLSPEMRRCLERISEAGGTITRYPGGFWYPKEGMASVGTTTVKALVKRGALEYCEWKESHGRQFPIKARLTPNASDQRPGESPKTL